MTAATMTEAWAQLLDHLPPAARIISQGAVNTRALEECLRLGWSVEQIALVIEQNLGPTVYDPAGIAVRWIKQIAGSKIGPQAAHTPASGASADLPAWHQPLPPCGACDGTPGRLYDTPTGLRHCPNCWTQPPGYREPVQACSRCHNPTPIRTPWGVPMCAPCGAGVPLNLVELR